MINPDASAVSDSDAIIIQNMGDLQVLQNDIIPMINIDTGTGDVSGQSNTNKRSVGSHLEARRKSNLALELHDLGLGTLDSSDKLLGGSDSNSLSALTTSGDANGIVLSIAFNTPTRETEIFLGKRNSESRKDTAENRGQLHLGS